MAQVYNALTLAAQLKTEPPWRLLDGAQINDDGTLTGYKCFSVNEGFFIGHFPGHPIVPGVLQLEAMRQLIVLGCGKGKNLRIRRIEKVKFRKPFLPGDKMKVEAKPVDGEAGQFTFAASCSNAAGLCCEAKITMEDWQAPYPVATTLPEIASAAPAGEGAMDSAEVMALMPHRYPFLLIDRIASVTPEKVFSVKNVTANEDFFSRGFETLPEVLLCEITAQSGAACVLSRPENKGKLGLFMAIDRAEFFRPVLPGDELVIESTLPPSKSRFGKGTGIVKVNGKKVMEISLMFAIVEA